MTIRFVHNPTVDMWPEGVVTREDGVKFCQLLCGKKAKILDYRERLPFESNDSWLFFIRGGCKEGTPLFALKHCIPAINQEVQQYAIDKVGNRSNPELAFIVGKIWRPAITTVFNWPNQDVTVASTSEVKAAIQRNKFQGIAHDWTMVSSMKSVCWKSWKRMMPR